MEKLTPIELQALPPGALVELRLNKPPQKYFKAGPIWILQSNLDSKISQTSMERFAALGHVCLPPLPLNATEVDQTTFVVAPEGSTEDDTSYRMVSPKQAERDRLEGRHWRTTYKGS